MGAVVIGRNEGSRLVDCLQSVLAQTPFVVYADSGSTDGSCAVAKELGVAVVVLSPDRPFSAARGRNEGAKRLLTLHPDCEAIQFVDGDCILQTGWIDHGAAELARRPDAAVVCGRRFEAHPSASLYNAMCDREWDTPVGRSDACGGDFIVRTAAWNSIGGFNPRLSAGEEPELAGRLRARGWQVWRIGNEMTEHDMKMTRFRQWWVRCRRGGFGYAQVWSSTSNLPTRLYGRQLTSALAWSTILPVLTIMVAVLSGKAWALLTLPALWVVQFARIALRLSGDRAYAVAALTMLAKVPESIGALRFFLGFNHAPSK